MRAPVTHADRARHALGLIEQGQLKAAERLLKDVLRADASQFDALLGMGVLSGIRGQDGEAVKHLRRACARNPRSDVALYNLGQALIRLGRHQEAAQALQAAADLADAPHIREKLGDCHRQLGQFDEAAGHYRRAVSLAGPRASGMLLSSLVETQRRICDWSGLEAAEQQLLASAARGDPVEPLLLLYVSDDPALAHKNAIGYATRFLPTILSPEVARASFTHNPRQRDRLRVGYLCSDFRQHATAHLMAELFEAHDKSRFEVLALSFGPADDSVLRRRICEAVAQSVDLARLDDLAAAKHIHALGVDVLIDLNGYIANARPGILLARPAPVQCHYVAFPGTLGSDAIDYMLVDPVIAPQGADAHFTERLVRLPDCYQPNDSRRPVSAEPPSRADCGLPDKGVVLASFNNPIKISPEIFAVWMRVLAARPDSVLWLFADSTAAPDHLRQAATAAGIAPERLVFAAFAEPAQHLARLALADLVLDCHPYGAHTTASDALFMGVPVLTLQGRSFASRVGASLLRAVEMPELITTNVADYEREAIALTGDRARLAAFKQRLVETRPTWRLLDTARLARNIEWTYAEMWRRWRDGEAPAAFDVPADAGTVGS